MRCGRNPATGLLQSSEPSKTLAGGSSSIQNHLLLRSERREGLPDESCIAPLISFVKLFMGAAWLPPSPSSRQINITITSISDSVSASAFSVSPPAMLFRPPAREEVPYAFNPHHKGKTSVVIGNKNEDTITFAIVFFLKGWGYAVKASPLLT